MASSRYRLTWLILLGAVCVIALVTALNYWPPLVQLDNGPAGQIEAWYAEYAGGGSCEWRDEGVFHLALLVGLLAWPSALFSAVRFGVALASGALEERKEPAVGLAVSLLLLLWLLRLGFVHAALELC